MHVLEALEGGLTQSETFKTPGIKKQLILKYVAVSKEENKEQEIVLPDLVDRQTGIPLIPARYSQFTMRDALQRYRTYHTVDTCTRSERKKWRTASTRFYVTEDEQNWRPISDFRLRSREQQVSILMFQHEVTPCDKQPFLRPAVEQCISSVSVRGSFSCHHESKEQVSHSISHRRLKTRPVALASSIAQVVGGC